MEAISESVRPRARSDDDPLHLQSSDRPGMSLITNQLHEHNYLQWKISMETALGAKMKLGFVNGDVLEPSERDPNYNQWLRVDRMVRSWILKPFIGFLYFFGNVFDPRDMRTSVQGSGLYINRERCSSIDPIHIDDPLFPTNNVGRNCFRIHQCIKAFSEAYSILESEVSCLRDEVDESSKPPYSLLPKIISSNYLFQGI